MEGEGEKRRDLHSKIPHLLEKKKKKGRRREMGNRGRKEGKGGG